MWHNALSAESMSIYLEDREMLYLTSRMWEIKRLLAKVVRAE